MSKYETIQKIFENHSNPERAISMSKYMKDQFSFYGIAASDRRDLYKDFLKLTMIIRITLFNKFPID